MTASRAIRTWAKNLSPNAAVRSAGTLVSGTAAAQAITVVALPFLTRLYSPTDFTILAIYTAILFIVSWAATGRFDLAIPIAEQEEEAANLLVLAVLCSALTGLLATLLLLLVGHTIVHLASIEEMGPYLWLLPISIFLSGSFIGLQRWCLRRKLFGSLATTRISQSATGTSIQLGLGLLGWKPIGLLIGHLMISGAGSIKLTRDLFRHDWHLLRAVSWRSLRETASNFRAYPQYSVVDTLAAGAGNQLTMLIIAAITAGPVAGLLLLTTRLVGAPVQLISGAIGQVYHSGIRESLQEGRLAASTARLVRALMLYGGAPLLFFSLASTPLFGIVFGERWAAAGLMMMWVAPWFTMRLVVTPLLSLPAAVGQQRLMMVARIATMLVKIAAVYVGYYLWNGRAVEALAIASVADWLFLLALLIKMAKVRIRQLGLAFVIAPVVAALLGLLVADLISPVVAHLAAAFGNCKYEFE